MVLADCEYALLHMQSCGCRTGRDHKVEECSVLFNGVANFVIRGEVNGRRSVAFPKAIGRRRNALEGAIVVV